MSRFPPPLGYCCPSGGHNIVYRTIDQLARYAGVTWETILVYQAEGLLSYVELDHQGQPGYTPPHAEQMLTIRTLTEAGVAISSIRNLAAASVAEIEMTFGRPGQQPGARIQGLERTHRRLRQAAGGRRLPQRHPR